MSPLIKEMNQQEKARIRAKNMKLDNSVEDWFSAMRDIFNNLDYDITPSTKTGSRK